MRSNVSLALRLLQPPRGVLRDVRFLPAQKYDFLPTDKITGQTLGALRTRLTQTMHSPFQPVRKRFNWSVPGKFTYRWSSLEVEGVYVIIVWMQWSPANLFSTASDLHYNARIKRTEELKKARGGIEKLGATLMSIAGSAVSRLIGPAQWMQDVRENHPDSVLAEWSAKVAYQ